MTGCETRSPRKALRTLRAAAFLFSQSGLCAGSAFAASEEHGGGSRELFYQALNLAIVIAILVYAARKPVVQFFRDRRDRIQTDLNNAAALLSEAETRNGDIQRRLVDLQSEVEEIRESSRRRAEEESERVLAEARKSAERIHADAAAAIDQELQRARRDLRAEASDLALQLAAEILRERVGESDRDRLADEFITRIEASSHDGTGAPGPRHAGSEERRG